MNYIKYNDTDIQSFEYETTINSDGNIVGTCELGKATIQMLNDSNEYSSLKESWIQTVHGSFYIHDVSPVQERVNIKLECYDIKYKLDKKYDSSKHTFPCSLKEWRNSIFDDCEVEYDNSDFPNSDLILQEKPNVGDNSSNRQVLCQISQAGMSFITTDETDRFYFKWFEDTVHIADDWSSLTTEKEKSKSVNVMVLGRGDVEDNVKWPETLQENPVEFRIDNNYILDPQNSEIEYDQRYDVIQSLYDRINGFSYLIFNMTTQNINNKLSVKLGQKLKFLDIWDNELEAYIMTKKIVYLGGDLSNDDNYQIILSASEIKETSTEFSYSSSIKNEVLEVKRLADKINGIVEDTVKEVTNSTEKVTQMLLDVDSIKNTVSTSTSTLENNVELLKEQLTQLQQTANKLSITITNINQDGVNKVVTSNGFVFDESGLNLSKDGEPMSATLNWEGLLVKNYDTDLLDARGDRVITENLTVRKYLTAGRHRTEKFTDEKNRPCTGLFWIGDE